MFNKKAKLEAVTRELFTIAIGMVKSQKSPEEIQRSLAEYVAVSTKLSSHEAATLVNDVMKVFTEHVGETGVTAEEPHALVEVSNKTHILPAGAKVLTAEEYKAEMEKRAKAKQAEKSPELP